MEVPRVGVELELQLPAYVTATATPNPSHICDLHHSSRQRWILNPLSEARDPTCILMGTSRVLHLLSHNRNSFFVFFNFDLSIVTFHQFTEGLLQQKFMVAEGGIVLSH